MARQKTALKIVGIPKIVRAPKAPGRRGVAGISKIAHTPVDAETRIHDDHHLSLRLWLRLLSCTNQIESRIRQNLQARFETTLPRFDLMAQLERTPDGLKMSELSQRMMVTGGNVTGITDGLEKEGLVVREVDAADRRVFRVKLTIEGERQFRRLAAEHEQWIVDMFEPLGTKRKALLAELLGELKTHVCNQGKS
jgi:DNA-binding MarR family transcriptional regulator